MDRDSNPVDRTPAAHPPHQILNHHQWIAVARAVSLTDGEITIAKRMGNSPHAVHAHLRRIFQKREVHSRSALVVRLFAAHLTRLLGNSASRYRPTTSN